MKKRHVLLMGGAIQLTAAVMSAGILACNTAVAKTSVHSTIPAKAVHHHPTTGKAPNDSLLWIYDTLSIAESAVTSHFSDSRKSPLRLTTIDHSTVRQRAVAKSYPEMLKEIPGLYATSESGSFGDAKVNIRGFKQENISILLNGIPISGQTSGNMYWNNWMGLADATYAIQVQKGVGSSMLADNSVGGTINIITTPATEKFYADLGVYATHYGAAKGYINVNSGTLPKGWSINFMGSYLGGKGYVDMTDVSTFSYMLNINKTFGLKHSLTFTAIGSPERHDQRSGKLSYEEVRKYGRKYNKNWGYLNGKPYNLNRNNYFKPYFTLHHKFSDGKWSMQNSLYLAIAHGGGRWNESKGNRMSNIMNAGGLIDFDSMIAENKAIAGSSAEGREGGAKYILSDFMAGHTQVGGIVSGAVQIDSRWRLESGFHYQHYSTWEKERITDLLGGNYWWEEGNCSADGNIRKTGDYIRTNNGKVTDHFTLYVQSTFDTEKWHINLGLSGIGAVHSRWDRFNYTEEQGIRSKKASGVGFSSKAGVLYKPGRGHSIYINGGAYSRVPYPGVYFSSGNNEITENTRNERNYLGELGYRFTYNRGGVEVTGYYSYWKNKTLMSNKYKPVDGDEKKYMINGLDARHFGVEIEAFHRFGNWLKLSAFASVGNWKWQNDVVANIYDEYNGGLIDRIDVYCKGLYVGDAPQTQLGAAAEFSFLNEFRIKVDWTFNDRMYADFDPSRRTDETDTAQSYRLPSCHLLNAHIDWTHSFKEKATLSIFAECGNILDTFYIERGQDGSTHNLDSFRGFWAFGRNFSFGTKIKF